MKPGYLSEVFVSFQGEGAHVGRRHLFVRLAGCNLRCRYCDTPDSLERTPGYTVHAAQGRTESHPNPVRPGALAGLIRTLLESEQPIDAIALTGGEPLTQSEFLAECLCVGGFSTPVLLETNGVLPGRLKEVLPLVDIISMDIKPPSNTGEGAFWDQHAEFLSLSQGKDISVKILVDQTTADDEISRATALVARINAETPTFLQPIVDPAGRSLIDADRLAHLFALGRLHLDGLRVLPQTHKLLGIR